MDDVRDPTGTPSPPYDLRRPRPAATDDAGLDASAVIGGLKRHKWLLLACVLIGTAAAVLLFLLIEPRYTATAEIIIEPQQHRLFDSTTATAGGLILEDAGIETQVKVLGARSTVQHVIDILNLAADPEFNRDLAPAAGTSDGPWRRVRERMRSVLARQNILSAETAAPTSSSQQGGAGWTFPPPRPDGTSQPADEATFQRFMDRLTISREGQSGVISVGFVAATPEKAARIVNTLVNSYVLTQVRTKSEVAKATGGALMDQVERLRGQVLEAEKAVEQYRASNDLVDGSGGSLIDEQLAAMNSELIEARAGRIAMQTKLQQVRVAAARRNGYRTIPEVVAAPGMVKLLERESELLLQEATLGSTYGEKSPAFIELKAQQARLAEKIVQDVGNIIRSLDGQAEVARAREQVLEERLAAAKRDSASARGAGLQLRELEREAASRRTVYETMLLRLREDQQEKDLLQPDVRVISAAVAPAAPTFPKLSVMAAIGILGSAFTAIALAALREHLDRGLRTGRQVERALDLPVLTMIPRLKGRRRSERAHCYLLENPRSAFAEAIKALQLVVRRALPAATTPAVMITSSLPGEGKTTVALNLAASMARAGCRTVLVDLDLRHPEIAHRIGGAGNGDLAQYVKGELGLDDLLMEVPGLAGFHYIASAAAPSDPTDVLESRKLRDLFAALRSLYDFIVIDTTPTLGVTDPAVVAYLADAIIFVVQWQKTKEEVAIHGVDAIRRSGTFLLGSVLTQVDVRRHATYGYGDVGQYYGSYSGYFRNR